MNFLLIFENDFKMIIPEIFFITSIVFLLMYGVFCINKEKKLDILFNVCWLSIVTLIFTILLFINSPFESKSIFYSSLMIDEFATFIKIIVLSSTIVVILFSLDYNKRSFIESFEFVIIILLAVFGILLLVSSYDFITLYLAIELQSLCLYVLAAFKRNFEHSTEAGLKYFVLGAFSSGLLLFGFSLVYGFTGLTNFEDLSKFFTGFHLLDNNVLSTGVLLGVLLIASGLLFKLAVVPFHMWAPDVYEGSPTPITAFFAITPKIALLAIFLRLFLYTFYDLIDHWQSILSLCAIASMLVGAFGAMYQSKIKRLMAYSSIGHVGYILIGVIVGTIEGVQSLLVYTCLYIIMTIGAFGIILSLRNKENNQQIKYIDDLKGLSKSNPLLAITFTLILFSMAGIPPLAGFFGKMFIFMSAIESSMYVLAVIGVLSSAVAAYYYIRLVKIMYFDKTLKNVEYVTIDVYKSIILGISFFTIVFFFIYPNPLMLITHKITLVLCL